jgi:hypothetical protein
VTSRSSTSVWGWIVFHPLSLQRLLSGGSTEEHIPQKQGSKVYGRYATTMMDGQLLPKITCKIVPIEEK